MPCRAGLRHPSHSSNQLRQIDTDLGMIDGQPITHPLPWAHCTRRHTALGHTALGHTGQQHGDPKTGAPSGEGTTARRPVAGPGRGCTGQRANGAKANGPKGAGTSTRTGGRGEKVCLLLMGSAALELTCRGPSEGRGTCTEP
jgi:hypothetical protein